MKTIIVTYFDNILHESICHAYVVSESNYDERLAWIKKTLKRESFEGFYSKIKISVVDRIHTSMLL